MPARLGNGFVKNKVVLRETRDFKVFSYQRISGAVFLTRSKFNCSMHNCRRLNVFGMQDFDFCPNLIKFCPDFLSNLSKFIKMLSKFA